MIRMIMKEHPVLVEHVFTTHLKACDHTKFDSHFLLYGIQMSFKIIVIIIRYMAPSPTKHMWHLLLPSHPSQGNTPNHQLLYPITTTHNPN